MGNFSDKIWTNEYQVRFYIRCEKKIRLLPSELNIFCSLSQKLAFAFKGAVMQIEKTLRNNSLHVVKKVFKKVASFLTDSIVFCVYEQNLMT